MWGLVRSKAVVPVPVVLSTLILFGCDGKGSKVLPLPSNGNKYVSYGWLL